MLENHINATLSVEDAQAVLDAVAVIKQKLPFLLDLSLGEGWPQPQLSEASQSFAQTALQIAEEHPQMLPRSFDLDGMRRNWELLQALSPLDGSVAQLHQMFDDALALVGSEVMMSAMLIYRVVQATKGHDEEKTELATQFARQKRELALAA